MTSSEATCLLCLAMNKNTLNFYSDTGKEMKIINILSVHFWFTVDEINAVPNICYECLNKIVPYHEFYESVKIAHKKFEPVFVKVENDPDLEDYEETYHWEPEVVSLDEIKIENNLEIEDDRETYQSEQVSNEYIQDDEDDESLDLSVWENTYINSIDTETRGNKTCEDVSSFDLLPQKSVHRYLCSYNKFMAWKASRKISKESFSETVMLEYFHCMKNEAKLKPTSLWAEYSKLRTTIQKNHGVDISYPELRKFLKMSSVAYLPRQCEVFRPDEIKRFLCEAEDYSFLVTKVIMIFAIVGLKLNDLLLDVNNVIKHGSVFVIKIPDTKTNGFRSFTVENEYATYVQKYKELRPENITHNRFFINYQNGKCTAHVIGKAKLAKTSQIMAKFLHLKNPENYSLLSFRKKSLKRGMHSSSALDECIPNKKKNSELNSEQMIIQRSTAITTLVDPSSFAIASTSPTTARSVCEDVEATAWDLLPGKSREKYVRSYENFMAWKTDENIDKECFSEAVMLKYFNYLKSKYKPTSLLAEYSKLNTTIQKNHNNVDISYPEVKSFLKLASSGYQPQKCNFFQPDEILRFLSEADDKEFLVVKVIMIFGIYGVSKGHELTTLEANDVIQEGPVFVIKIRNTKTNGFRSLCVEKEYAPYVQKYKELRPKNISLSRFFINYQKGKCYAQPIGVHKFSYTPKVIAKFLNLEDVENYTLKSFPKKILKSEIKL